MSAHNNRRRLLALLALAAAPSALWSAARAQDTYIPITCTATADTAASQINFRGYYHIVEGKLTLSDPPAHFINQSALKATYSGGTKYVKRDTDPKGFNVRVPNFRIDNPGEADTIVPSFSAVLQLAASPMDINGRLTLADGSQEDAYVKFYNPSEENGLTQIDTSWTTKSSLLLSKPLTVELIADGKPIGKFSFDMSKVKWKAYVDKEAARIAAASGVTYDANTTLTTVEGCSSPGSGMGGCFFTTATVETLGLSDDCWELRTLRAFRDGPLATTSEGRALTARYYAEAPRLVEGVNRRADAAQVWLAAYWSHIVPCAVMAKLGLVRAATTHYRRLFDRLEALAT